MRKFGLAALIGLLMLTASAEAAITWTITANAQCTAFGAPAACCSASGQGECPVKFNIGNKVVAWANVVGTSGGTYTNPGGDAIAATEMQKLGLNTVQVAICDPMIPVAAVVPLAVQIIRQANVSNLPSVKVKIFTTAGAELANATALATTATMDCLFIGY